MNATDKKNIFLSASAIKKLSELLKEEPQGNALCIQVLGGGCSGFQYELEIKQPHAEDHVYQEGDARVCIDDMSLPFVEGSTLDYEDDLSGSRFVLKNPNAATSCGCGNSFSL